MDQDKADELLRMDGLQTYFHTEEGVARAVDGVSFHIESGETLGLVGESGCGKSVTALSILRLIDSPGRIDGGSILFDGRDLLSLPKRSMRRVRGRDIAMIFQEPMTSLNPVFTIGYQIEEAIRLHQRKQGVNPREVAVEMLRKVGIGNPERRVTEYPHQLSGGMKQRAMIAMALVCRPALLIADEPTTALDVTIQAQILDLVRNLQREMGMAVLLITHDLGVVAEMADRVAVMYAGRVVEMAGVRDLFADPKHPYTVGLFKSLPSLIGGKDRLAVIPGTVPSPIGLPEGCRFCPRCPMAIDRCKAEYPPFEEKASGHWSACWVMK